MAKLTREQIEWNKQIELKHKEWLKKKRKQINQIKTKYL